MKKRQRMRLLLGLGAYTVQILRIHIDVVIVKLLTVESIGVELPVVPGEEYAVGGFGDLDFCKERVGEIVYLRVYPGRPDYLRTFSSLGDRPVPEPEPMQAAPAKQEAAQKQLQIRVEEVQICDGSVTHAELVDEELHGWDVEKLRALVQSVAEEPDEVRRHHELNRLTQSLCEGVERRIARYLMRLVDSKIT